jgi:hypothetical protein
MDSRFIFHPDNRKSLNFTQVLKLNPDESTSRSSSLQVTEPIIKSLYANHRDSYKSLAKLLEIHQKQPLTKQELFPIEVYDKGIIHIVNGITNPLGVLLTEKNVYINGGCLCNAPQYMQMSYTQIKPKIPHVTNVISIAAMWGGEIWHFPSEAFVALMSVPETNLNDKNTYIHVSKKTSYVMQWLSLLHIDETRVIDGFVHAEHLYIPRMGKCGNPYKSQIVWLKDLLYRSLSLRDPFQIILVKRNHKRALHNFDAVKSFVYAFANTKNLDVYEHDDSNLPSLQIQQEQFHRAKYVFAPHGAAGIHLFAMQPQTHYVEFLDIGNMNVCYMRLAYLLNIHYIGIEMVRNNVNMEVLLHECKI